MIQPPLTNSTRSTGAPCQALDLGALIDLLGRDLDDSAVHDSLVRMSLGAEPVAHVAGNTSIGESRTYFFPAAGVIVCATDYSGKGQRIGQVTLVGRARRVYLDGREYTIEAFGGLLPLAVEWGQSRADILGRLGPPALSNDGISISARPKSPLNEMRDADEFQQADVIVRLIYSDCGERSGCLEEIDLQRTVTPTR